MVKVSAGASRIFVEHFESHTAKNLEVSDAELTIARVRETLGSKLISKDKQVAAAAKALVFIKALILEHAPELQTAWTSDEWSDAMWDLLEPATSHTLAGQSCSEVFGTSELWEDAVTMALAETSEQVTEVVSAAWSHRWLVGMVLFVLAGLMWKVPQWLEATAKTKFATAVTSLFFVGVGSWWTLRGPVYLVSRTIQEEKITSVKVQTKEVSEAAAAKGQPHADATKELRRQLEELQAELEKSKASQKPPMPPPALAPLMTSVDHLALQEQETF